METLAPAAEARGDKIEVLKLAILCLALNLAFLLPVIVVLFWNGGSLLVWIGQPVEVAELATVFLRGYLASGKLVCSRSNSL